MCQSFWRKLTSADADLPPACFCMIDNIIMNKTCCVDHLTDDGNAPLVFDNLRVTWGSRVMIECVSKAEGDHGTNCLSLPVKIIFWHFPHVWILQNIAVEFPMYVGHHRTKFLFGQLEWIMNLCSLTSSKPWNNRWVRCYHLRQIQTKIWVKILCHYYLFAL